MDMQKQEQQLEKATHNFRLDDERVDVLGTLSEKLKQLNNEAKDHHSSFTDLTKLYKEDKINLTL